MPPEVKKRLLKIIRFFLTVIVLGGVLVLVYFVTSSVYYDWARSKDMATLQNALGQYYLDYKAYPAFAGVLTGNDLVNSALKREKLIRKEIREPREETGKAYYYRSNGKYYWVNYCLSTNFFKAGRRGCDNQILVSQ